MDCCSENYSLEALTIVCERDKGYYPPRGIFGLVAYGSRGGTGRSLREEMGVAIHSSLLS